MAHCTPPRRRLSTRLGRVIGLIAAVPIGLLWMSPAWADNCTGYDVLVMSPADATDLGHGMKQIGVKGQSVVLSNDSIFNLVVGECAGTVLQTPDGKSQSEGYCARHDKAGDTQSVAWRQAPGADKGEWKEVDGTGKFAGKQGTGWTQQVYADGKVLVVKWGGDCH
jgi:hypothetical protein